MAATVVTAPAPKPKIITLDTITPREMTWLWHPYIPTGTVTAVFGRGGQGKTYLTCDLAARLSRGVALPDGEKPEKPSRVLMLSAEDDYATVLVPRLMKLGADLKNIAVPSFQFTLDKKGSDNVRDLMRDFSAAVVFIDPIVYYAGGRMDMNKSNEVRAMMEGLKKSADESNSAVIIVGHIRKSEEGAEADRMMGSADWVNAARSGLLVTKTNDGQKVMKHVKTNYGQLGLARGFEITDNGFEWGTVFGEDDLPLDGSDAGALQYVSGGGGARSKAKEKAIAFLRTILKDGPLPAKEVELLAADNEISQATLNRAKNGVAESYYSRSAETYYWRLIQK